MATTERNADRGANGELAGHHAARKRYSRILLFFLACAVLASGVFGITALAARAKNDSSFVFRIAPSYANGRAFEKDGQSTDDAIRIWRKAAWQNDDLMAQIELGKIYSSQNKYRDYYDPVEAYVWYFMATRADQHYYSDDSYVLQKISTGRYDAKQAQDSIYYSLSLEQRMQARERIIYILGSRGTEGYISLAQLHQVLPPAQAAPELSCIYNPSWYRQFVNWIHSWFSSEEPEAHPGDFDWVYTGYLKDNQKTETAERCKDRPRPSGAPPPRKAQTESPSENSVLIRNNDDALMYLFIAKERGHPFADAYIESLEYTMSDNGKYNIDDSIAKAEQRADLFALPFEYYQGTTIGDTPHSDERLYSYKEQDALGRSSRIPPSAIDQALDFRGYMHVAPGKRPTPDDRRKAVMAFQKALRFEPTGFLTPEQTVRLIQIAASSGDAASQNRLGIMYAKDIGVPRNFPRAEYWFQTAGQQLYGEALFNLSILYRKGVLGVPQNQDKAERYHDAAGKAGYRPVHNELMEILTQSDSQDGRPP